MVELALELTVISVFFIWIFYECDICQWNLSNSFHQVQPATRLISGKKEKDKFWKCEIEIFFNLSFVDIQKRVLF